MSNELKKESLLEQIKSAKYEEVLYEKLEKKVEATKGRVRDILEDRYSLLLSSDDKDSYRWSPGEFSIELQLILRSALTRDRIVKVPEGESYGRFNLTTQHGLKYPRTWRPYNFLPWNDDREPILKDENYYLANSQSSLIKFSVLRDSKYIKQDKLDKFFFFLRKILKVYNLRVKIEHTFNEQFKEIKGFADIKNLTRYSSLDIYEKFLKGEPKLKLHYVPYSEGLKGWEEKAETLLKELKIFNKPFRLFLTLKDGSNS